MSTIPSSKYVDFENVRPGNFRETYEEIARLGINPFDQEEFLKRHPHPIFSENEHWFATHNAVPYEGAGLHLLFIHKAFITSIEEISPSALQDLWALIEEAKERFEFESGALMMRFGDTSQTGATVTHLHAHIIVAKKEKGKRKVIFPHITAPN